MWGSLWMVLPSMSAPNFVSVTPSICSLFPILRRNEASTFWSSFLIFLCFANCILGIQSFWANIHLSVSAYHVYSFVSGLSSFLEWRTKYPWKELQRQSSELSGNKGPSRDCPMLGSILYTTSKPRHYCICQKDFADRTLI